MTYNKRIKENSLRYQKAKTDVIQIRVLKDVKQRYKQAAQHNNLSLSRYIINLVETDICRSQTTNQETDIKQIVDNETLTKLFNVLSRENIDFKAFITDSINKYINSRQ